MKKLIVIGLALLAAACGGDKEKPIQYGAPEQPTYTEQSAASTAQATLQGSLTFAPTTQPTYGAMGLADQLVANLGGYPTTVATPSARVQKSAGRALSQAFDTGGMDPGCVVIDATTATWTRCIITVTDTDPYSGDTLHMTIEVNGTLEWDAVTGETTWNIDEKMVMAMTMPQEGASMTMDALAELDGAVTVTASTIVGNTSSAVTAHGTYRASGMDLPLDEGLRTTLAMDLGYQADPFCVTSGWLELEQRWTRRPMFTTEADLPNQGWRFDWTGCNLFTVSHGS